jgi:hypothetical protein
MKLGMAETGMIPRVSGIVYLDGVK